MIVDLTICEDKHNENGRLPVEKSIRCLVETATEAFGASRRGKHHLRNTPRILDAHKLSTALTDSWSAMASAVSNDYRDLWTMAV
jgi:hypothetical protein